MEIVQLLKCIMCIAWTFSTSLQKPPTTYTRVNDFRPHRDSLFRGATYTRERLIREYIRYVVHTLKRFLDFFDFQRTFNTWRTHCFSWHTLIFKNSLELIVCVHVCMQRMVSTNAHPQSSVRRTDQMHRCPVSPRVSPAVGRVRPSHNAHDVRRDERSPAATQDVRTPTGHSNTSVPRAGAPPQSPVSYRTMYVCNIGDCNRGFAYKKNLVTHQHNKHNLYHWLHLHFTIFT